MTPATTAVLERSTTEASAAPAKHRCPNCHTADLDMFHRLDGVPVHSCLMLDDAEQARNFPRRPMALGCCAACGFVSNVLFDESVHDYAERYEDQQTFSAKFRAFQSGLIQRLIRDYGIRGRTVTEIGCGKGDFLAELCREGGNRGIGIDPRSHPEAEARADGVEFVARRFTADYGRVPGDVVCCRHTLEHLPQTHVFVAAVREAMGDDPAGLVFFEVPDATRIWRDAAFWDVYYEHCSYFTPGSLARVFRANRFEVLEIDRVFDRQYLMLVARPSLTQDTSLLPIEETPIQVGDWVARFAAGVAVSLPEWRMRLLRWQASGRRAAVWGAGSKCVAFLSAVGCADAIDAIVDINPHQQGRYLPGLGRQIVAPESLRTHRPDVVLVMNPAYRDEIVRQLSALRILAEVVTV